MMTEYGEAFVDNDGYLVHKETNRRLHVICWLVETNRIREDFGLKPLTNVPKWHVIHQKDGCRTNYEYNNLQCVHWLPYCKYYQKKR